MAQLPKPIADLINAFERLPGIGPKSATRLAFYLLSTPEAFVRDFSQALLDFKTRIKYCRECYSVAENEVCEVCADPKRNRNQICVVERAIDMVAIENVGGYGGVYHVLGGVINPLDHVGPDDIRIGELMDRLSRLEGEVEVILAMNPTMEGEATALYIKKKCEELGTTIHLSRIGSGLPMGADLEFADAGTLLRAMEGRREI